jgi:hypothetical protein
MRMIVNDVPVPIEGERLVRDRYLFGNCSSLFTAYGFLSLRKRSVRAFYRPVPAGKHHASQFCGVHIFYNWRHHMMEVLVPHSKFLPLLAQSGMPFIVHTFTGKTAWSKHSPTTHSITCLHRLCYCPRLTPCLLPPFLPTWLPRSYNSIGQ